MTPVLDVRGLAYAYPDGHQALFGVDLHVHAGERVALLGPNGAGKTTLVLHLNGILTAGAGSVAVSGLPVEKQHLQEIRRRVGIVFQDPDDQLFLGTVRQDVAFGPANLGLRGAALETAGDGRRWSGSGWRSSPTGRRTTCPSASAAASPSPPCWPWSRRSWCSTSRRPTSTPPRGASSPTSCARLDVTVLMVTHDLPYALELCPRSVVLSDGVVVADGATYDVLTDDALMAAHRLELPFGFDPRRGPVPGVAPVEG